jgi:acetyltransferase
MVSFHRALSERTVYLRYFQPLKLSQRVTHERLTRICFQDYDRELALVVEHKNPAGGPEIIAVGRLSKLHTRDEAELAVLVHDGFQHLGIGTELNRRLIAIARDEKLRRVVCSILAENREMRAICQKLGFRLARNPEDEAVQAELVL